MKKRSIKAVLLRYLRAGIISEHEAAYAAGISQQAVNKWCRVAGINVRQAQHKRFLRILARIQREAREVGVVVGGPHGKAQLGARKGAHPAATRGAARKAAG